MMQRRSQAAHPTDGDLDFGFWRLGFRGGGLGMRFCGSPRYWSGPIRCYQRYCPLRCLVGPIRLLCVLPTL